MKFLKFELNEQQLNNLIVFLDRVPYKGFQEIQAIDEIMAALRNPVQDTTGDSVELQSSKNSRSGLAAQITK